MDGALQWNFDAFNVCVCSVRLISIENLFEAFGFVIWNCCHQEYYSTHLSTVAQTQ